MIKQANKHRRDVSFQVGDLVYLKSNSLALSHSFNTRKLAPKFVGPFPVLERVGASSYKPQLPMRFKRTHSVFHVSLLRPHHGDAPAD